MPNLRMLTGLCGPEFSLSRGDEREFDEAEASRLIRAGFAVALDDFVPLPPETDADAPVDDDEAAAAKAAEESAAAAKAEQGAAEAKAAEEAAAAAKPEPAAKPATAKAKG